MFRCDLKQVCNVLEPLVLAQATVEGDTCTLCDVMITVRDLYRAFASVSCQETKAFLLKKLEKRWKRFVDPKLMILAVALHPGHRLVLFKANPQVLNFHFVKKLAGEFYREYCGGAEDEVNSRAVSSYMLNHAPYTDRVSTTEDIRPFWQISSDVHPALSKIAIFLYEACPQAAGLERIWSSMGNIMTKARNRIANDKARSLAVVKMYLLKEKEVRRTLPKLPEANEPAKELNVPNSVLDLEHNELIDGYDNSVVASGADESAFDQLFFAFNFIDEDDDLVSHEITEPDFITLKQIFGFSQQQ